MLAKYLDAPGRLESRGGDGYEKEVGLMATKLGVVFTGFLCGPW